MSEFSNHLLAEYRKARLTAQIAVAVVMGLSVVLLYFSWWNPPYPVEPATAGHWVGVVGRGLGAIGIAVGLAMSARLNRWNGK